VLSPASNVMPERAEARLNIRFNPCHRNMPQWDNAAIHRG
jgi:hypothetical protein